MHSSHTCWRTDMVLLPVIVFLLFSVGLGDRPYMNPSEARYIEIPRQMIATGDWLTPRINGVPYFEKPPLFYWMQASFIRLGGLGEFSGRTVTALLTTLTCLLAYVTARLLYDRPSGLLAATVLATSLLGYGISRVAVLDVPVTFFITACLTSFLLAQRAPTPLRRYCYWLMYLSSALAVMSKGLIGMVLPALVIGGWIAITNRWLLLKQARLFSGTLLFLAMVAPWHIMMAQRHPDFLNFYFIHEHFTRYLTSEHHRNAPWWFFLAIVPLGLMPWTGLLPLVIRQVKGQGWRHPDTLYMALWIILPLIFFSCSQSKLVSYIFVIFPPLAVLMGHTLSRLWAGTLPLRILRQTAILFIIACLLASAFVSFFPPGKWPIPSVSPLLLLPLLPPLGLLCYALFFKQSPAMHIVALAMVGTGLGLSINNHVAAFDTSGIRPLAFMLKPRMHSDDMVVSYKTYWQDLPVYLGQDVTVVEWKGELLYGVTQTPHTEAWMIGDNEFWERCATHQHNVYMFAKTEIFDTLPQPASCTFSPLAHFGKTVLAKRVPATPH